MEMNVTINIDLDQIVEKLGYDDSFIDAVESLVKDKVEEAGDRLVDSVIESREFSRELENAVEEGLSNFDVDDALSNSYRFDELSDKTDDLEERLDNMEAPKLPDELTKLLPILRAFFEAMEPKKPEEPTESTLTVIPPQG